MELVCDKNVTAKMNKSQRARYSETILDSILPKKKIDLAITTCFYGNKKMMKKRIENVFDEKPKKPGYLVMAFILVLFIGFDLLISSNYTHAEYDAEKSITEIDSDKLQETTSQTEIKYFSEGGAHPYNNNLSADTKLCISARDKLFEGLCSEDIVKVSEQIRKAHWWIEFRLIGAYSWEHDSLEWNNIDHTFDTYTSYGITVKLAHLDYTGIECIESLKAIKEIVNNNYFSIDIDRAAGAMQDAIDNHDMQKLYEFHQIMHDLDYWLINYPLETFKSAPADWHGVYVYFGVLESYKCVQ